MELDRLGVLLQVDGLSGRLDRVEEAIHAAVLVPEERHRDALHRVAGAGGKRLRPALTISCAQLFDVWDERVVDVAAAVELVQIGSLVHDDIIDDAETRRGIPTINAVEGDEVAIVGGDLVLARAGELAGRVHQDAGVLVNSTIAILCRGQFSEMADLFDAERTLERHLASVRDKTAALFAASCRLGAMCAGAEPEVVDALGRYGEAFGMAFQLLDDVLDVVGDAGRLGKPVGVDIPAGVYTLPVLHVLGGPQGEQLRAHLDGDGAAARAAVLAGGGIEAAQQAMSGFTADAVAALEPLARSGVAVEGLSAFPDAYLEWALEQFAVVG